MTDYELILCGVGVLVVLAIVWKFGKALARFVLALAALAVVGVGAAALLTQGVANYESAKATTKAVEAVKVASVGQTVTTLVIGGLVLALVTAIGAAVYLWARWRLAQRQTLASGGRRRLPRRREALPPSPMVYYVTQEPEVDAVDLDLAEWGWQ